MAKTNILQLKQELDAKRASFSCFPAYMKPYQLRERFDAELRNKPDDADLIAFGELLSRYIALGEELLLEQSHLRDLSRAREIVVFAHDLVQDPCRDENDKLLEKLIAYYGDGEGFKATDQLLLLYLIVSLYRSDDFRWRGKKYAKALREALRNSGGPRQVYGELAAFYRSVLDHPSASEVLLSGAQAFLLEGNLEDAALLKRDGLATGVHIPGFVFPSEEDIRKQFGEKADVVLSYPRHAGLKHDPIEASPEFQKVYDEVMEEAMAKYLALKGGRMIFALWGFMQEGFARHGIMWKNPQWMNPRARFD